jgi:phage terminase large subunit GpA-like protein
MDDFADLDAVIARAMGAWRPPPRLSLSEWADRFFVLSAETAAEPGRWRSLPYQVELLNSITDPTVTQVSVMKSARIGYSLCMSASIAYFMQQDPSPILVVQPTVDDAKNFSKETIAPMLRDVPVLARLVMRDVEEKAAAGRGSKAASSTLTHKAFPGGVLSLCGANSGGGLRRISRRVILFDEVDAYPSSAGNDGDPILLGSKRSEAFHNRKIVAGSTPLTAGSSRIEELFLAGDQRRYHVPCPHCGHMDFLAFDRTGNRGHVMMWPDGEPEKAFFECRGSNCVIEHKDKRWMVERGKWIPDNPSAPASHRSYHVWSALSYSPNASWGQIAAEFLEAKRGGIEKLKTFVNTTLGETWKEKGEAPEWERLWQRREHYRIGSVPNDDVVALTLGGDVQKDRIMYEVVGWDVNKRSWSVEYGALYGDTSIAAEDHTSEKPSPWRLLDELLARDFDGFSIRTAAIDSGYNTQVVYNWARKYPKSRVMACKGMSGARSLVGSPTDVEVNINGRKMRRGCKLWPIGVDIAKAELYGWLQLQHIDGEPPTGYCHFPQYDDEYFKQLTAEHLVTSFNRKTHRQKSEWHVQPGRQNHILDARILARAAVFVLGIDRLSAKDRAKKAANLRSPNLPPAAVAPAPAATQLAPPPQPKRAKRPRSDFLGGSRTDDWFRRR